MTADHRVDQVSQVVGVEPQEEAELREEGEALQEAEEACRGQVGVHQVGVARQGKEEDWGEKDCFVVLSDLEIMFGLHCHLTVKVSQKV